MTCLRGDVSVCLQSSTLLHFAHRDPAPTGSVFAPEGGKAMNVKSLGKSAVRWMLAGLVGVLITGGHARDASAANVCNAALDSMFVSGPNFVVPGDATRDKVRLQLTLGAGTITGAPVPPGPQLTLHRLRFDLDCWTGAVPCGDQAADVSYWCDSTVTTVRPGATWSTNDQRG